MRILGNLFAEQYGNLSVPQGEELPEDACSSGLFFPTKTKGSKGAGVYHRQDGEWVLFSQGSASIRAMLKDLDVASWVDLSRPDTIAGVVAMEQFGILGAGRASEILNDPIQAVERPVDFRAFLAKGIS